MKKKTIKNLVISGGTLGALVIGYTCYQAYKVTKTINMFMTDNYMNDYNISNDETDTSTIERKYIKIR